MAIKDAFIAELRHEAALTREILERVPIDQKDWKPHEKSMSVGRLATHITETIRWISDIKRADDFDFASRPFKPYTVSSQEELLELFQTTLDAAIEDLSAMTDSDFDTKWTVRRGGVLVMEMPKKVAVRGWGFSHQIHHRGQLSVYLRLLGVAVPGMYGPSADER